MIESLKKSYQDQLTTIIHRHAPGCNIILFGSFARGDQERSSDIDIAIDCGQAISYQKIIAMQLDIDETTIPFKVDIVDVHNASEAIKESIYKQGIVWKN